MKIFWNGNFIAETAGKVPLGERRYFEGSALVENMRVTRGKIKAIREHKARLREGAFALLMREPDLGFFEGTCRRLLGLNRLREGNLRVRYFRDGAWLIHPFRLKALPKEWLVKGIRLMTSSVSHYGPDSLQARLKANSMLPNKLAAENIVDIAEDGLRLTARGYVAEGIWSNIALEKKGILFTPPLSLGVLEGTTRAALIRRWKSRGKRVMEIPLTRYDLYAADRVWVCSSLRGLLKVSSVDGRRIGA
ncbi:MAG: aminotransferase class IV [candidate division FCPU426 bacterium]